MASYARKHMWNLVIVGLVFFVSACQANNKDANLTDTPSQSAAVSPTPTLTPVQAAAIAFWSTWKGGDLDALAAMYSDYSLAVLGLTRDNVRAGYTSFAMAGNRLLDFKAFQEKVVSDDTEMIYVQYSYATADQKVDEINKWWVFHNEQGAWKLNAFVAEVNDMLVDDRPLHAPLETINGVTVQPLRVRRFTSNTEVIFAVDNQAARSIIYGFVGNERATLRFANGSLVEDNIPEKALVFAAGKNYPDAYIVIHSFIDSWPDAVELSDWQWSSPQFQSNPDTSSLPWSYTFSLASESIPTTQAR